MRRFHPARHDPEVSSETQRLRTPSQLSAMQIHGNAKDAPQPRFDIRAGWSFLGGRRHRNGALLLFVMASLVAGCDADLSPCARTEQAADGTPRVTLWVDCKDEQAAQLVAVRVTPKQPLIEAGTDGDAGLADAGDGGAVGAGAVDSGAVDSGAVDSGALDSGAVDSGAAQDQASDDAWRIQSPVEDGTDYFYVEYAVTPRGWDTLVAPQALVSGQLYEVEFVGTDIGSLSFDFKAP
ncbi:MAG: hypothetical protein R3B07_31185 [Polyangiaceae bacterium]